MLVAVSPMGKVRIRFVPRNEHRVLDHDAVRHDDEQPDAGARASGRRGVVFTVRRLALTDRERERDVAMVQADLERLRDPLEE